MNIPVVNTLRTVLEHATLVIEVYIYERKTWSGLELVCSLGSTGTKSSGYDFTPK
jgi:hypothetical protein